ncbi:MAG: hypothetical protein GY811_25240 [Myxococcales bacterium]|nr:hypothetical protein [Myxococcales bacterium]
MRRHIFSVLFLGAFVLSACGSVPEIPGALGSAKATDVNPNGCGNYAATDVGKKLKGFLRATLALDKAVLEAEAEMKISCAGMAKELGVSEGGDTKTVCNAVADSIKENLSVGLKAGAALTINYEQATCTMSASAAASAAASCEGKASADVGVNCEGTCNGTCNGECEGSTGSGGTCEGTCKGTCEGTCEGYADVEASAECEAQAEVSASLEAECTEPKLEVEFTAEVVLDGPKVEKVKAALMVGLPKLLMLQAKVQSPLRGAFETWAASAKELSDSSLKLARSLDDQATCVSGQLAGAFGMVAKVQASLDVQIEVSASISTSASAEGSAGGSAGS